MPPLLRDWVFLVLTPAGRADVGPYVIGGILTRIVAYWASYGLSHAAEGDPAGLYAFAALAAIWMWYCVSSRRLHDTGSGNGLLTLLLIAEAGLMLSVLDPAWIAKSEDPQTILDRIRLAQAVLNVGVCAYGVYLFKMPSDPGENAYGAPFGEAANGGWKAALPGTGMMLSTPRAEPKKVGIARLGAMTWQPSVTDTASTGPRSQPPPRRSTGFGKR